MLTPSPRRTLFASRFGRISPRRPEVRIACSFVFSAIACSPEIVLDPQEADAEVYVRALCEEKCAKFDECAPVPDHAGECILSRCIESYSSELDRPCFAQEDEWERCRVERESCAEYFSQNINTRPDSPCYALLNVATNCISQYENGGR